MALSTEYVLAPDLQSLFRDKDTALPLNSGYILFFRDSSRTVGKPIYRLDGTYPAYTVVPYGSMTMDGAWRTDLTDFGALAYLPIYKPYDDDLNIDRYFIEVYSADNVLQFTREGFPIDIGEINPGVEVAKNFIANGQFLLHTNIPATLTTPAGQVTTAITEVAYGGWTYERPMASTAVDNITFERFVPNNPNAAASPRYAIRLVNQSGGSGDTFNDLRVKFLDVNKFASTTQDYTFAFTGNSNGAGSVPANIYLIKNYGTGGTPSAQVETLLGTVNLLLSEGILAVNFIFGTNDGKTLGDNDDDFIQIAIRLPIGSAYDVSITDAILLEGNAAGSVLPEFPQTPDAEFLYQGIAGQLQIPPYDGSKIGLPLVLSRSGIVYDDGAVGSIYARCNYETLPFYLQVCDGSTFKTSDYTNEGIPRARLQAELFDATLNYPIYGTGENFVTATPLIGAPDTFRLTANKNGVVPIPANGASSPGFTYTSIADVSTLVGTDVTVWMESFGGSLTPIWIIDRNAAPLTVNPASDIFPTRWVSNYASIGIPAENVTTYPKTIVDVNVGATTMASKYFLFQVTNGTRILVWFKVDGIGTIPAIPHDYAVEINLLSTFSFFDVAGAIVESLNDQPVFTVQCVAGASITAGNYWEFETLTNQFYVWYKKDGVGTDPLVANKIGIEVDILSADTAAQVCTKTAIAINSAYYAIPDARGLFLRGRNLAKTANANDTALLTQYAPLGQSGYGYFQTDIVGSHTHLSNISGIQAYLADTGAFTLQTGVADVPVLAQTFEIYTNTQLPENTVRNLQVYWVIHI